MHRHGYKGRKFGRESAQRKALIKSLSESLIIHESIETTREKAKELITHVEKLITKAKKGDLHNRRQVVSALATLESAHKLVDEIAPKLQSRTSGHLRFERTATRRGDNAQLARVSFIFDEETPKVAKKPAAKAKTTAKKTAAKKPANKKPITKKGDK